MTRNPPFESRLQLIACLERQRRHAKLSGAVYLAFFVGLIVANAIMTVRGPTMSPTLQTVGFIAFTGLLALQLPLLLVIAKGGIDRFGLRCPGCRRALVANLGRIAVATGRCGECGCRVWRRSRKPSPRRHAV